MKSDSQKARIIKRGTSDNRVSEKPLRQRLIDEKRRLMQQVSDINRKLENETTWAG